MSGVLPGDYTLTVRTPSLDSVGTSVQRSIEFTDTASALEVSVPSAVQLATALCGSNPLGPTVGVIFGRVTAAEEPALAPKTNIAATWADVTLRDEHGATVGTRLRRIDTRADADGAFRICGVPLDAALTIRATNDRATSDDASIRLTDARFARVDLTLKAFAGNGAVFRGTVLDSMHVPIAGAEIAIPDVEKMALSDAHGAFVLAGIPAGDHRVMARHVGYGPMDADLTFGDRVTVERTIYLPRIRTLDSVKVSAEGIDPLMRDFEENRATFTTLRTSTPRKACRQRAT
jgi:hypothetical protein